MIKGGRCYKVVVDPTRNEFEPGDFLNRSFRFTDISGYCLQSFPEGIVFFNILSGILYQKNNGSLKRVTAQVCGTRAVERINNHVQHS